MEEDYKIPQYPIRKAAEILGISVHTMRMYEKEGLIIPFQKQTNHRLYSQTDIDRISCIRKTIRENKISIQGIKAIYSLIPCWKIINCSDNERENCPAFHNHFNPCWTFDHKNNICEQNNCRECEVYNKFTQCGQVKTLINKIMLD
jgi:MerR family transcriptional regulator/heat shock protein HspR